MPSVTGLTPLTVWTPHAGPVKPVGEAGRVSSEPRRDVLVDQGPTTASRAAMTSASEGTPGQTVSPVDAK